MLCLPFCEDPTNTVSGSYSNYSFVCRWIPRLLTYKQYVLYIKSSLHSEKPFIQDVRQQDHLHNEKLKFLSKIITIMSVGRGYVRFPGAYRVQTRLWSYNGGPTSRTMKKIFRWNVTVLQIVPSCDSFCWKQIISMRRGEKERGYGSRSFRVPFLLPCWGMWDLPFIHPSNLNATHTPIVYSIRNTFMKKRERPILWRDPKKNS